MTGKMVASLLGVAIVAGGVGGGAGWMIGRGSDKPLPFNVVEMLPDHETLADLCRKNGALVQVAVTAVEFDGKQSPVTDQTLDAIAAQHVNSTEPIRKLVLRDAQITNAGLAKIKECESFDFIESLNLTNCKGITDEGLEYIKRMATLETLNITGCEQITDDSLKSLLQTFRVFFNRKKLKILGRDGLETPEMLDDHATLADTCRKHGATVQVGVTAIEFDGEVSPVTDTTLAAIAAQRVNSAEPIRKLVLRNARITDAGLANLNKCESLDFVESLNLTNCKEITDAGLEHLKRRPALETLNVTGCDQITDAGLKSLLKAFRALFDRKKLKILGRDGLE